MVMDAVPSAAAAPAATFIASVATPAAFVIPPHMESMPGDAFANASEVDTAVPLTSPDAFAAARAISLICFFVRFVACPNDWSTIPTICNAN